MTNENWTISFNAAGVKTLGLPNSVLPERAYKAKITGSEPTDAKKEERHGEKNILVTVAITESEFAGATKNIYIPEPTSARPTTAKFAQQSWVSLAQSIGVPAQALTGQVQIAKADIEGRDCFVYIKHQEQKSSTGQTFIGENIRFITPHEYTEAMKAMAAAGVSVGTGVGARLSTGGGNGQVGNMAGSIAAAPSQGQSLGALLQQRPA